MPLLRIEIQVDDVGRFELRIGLPRAARIPDAASGIEVASIHSTPTGQVFSDGTETCLGPSVTDDCTKYGFH